MSFLSFINCHCERLLTSRQPKRNTTVGMLRSSESKIERPIRPRGSRCQLALPDRMSSRVKQASTMAKGWYSFRIRVKYSRAASCPCPQALSESVLWLISTGVRRSSFAFATARLLKENAVLANFGIFVAAPGHAPTPLPAIILRKTRVACTSRRG